MLLTQCNLTIKNPGPPGLSIMYQNVQGLIPLHDLGNKNPILNQTKINELQIKVYESSPDVLVLNETWLKPSINDNEILSPEAYKIFRCDRSPKTHPADLNKHKKFRKNGGGVLIALKTDLNITSRKINRKCNAEVLSVEITFSNNTKICISTCYRVGTLGSNHLDKIQNYYSSLMQSKKFSKIFIVGDFNLASANSSSWETGYTNEVIDQSFLDLFNNLGMVQCIKQSTHIGGNLLDILLTNSAQSVDDIRIEPNNMICHSDHFPISFTIKANVKRKKSAKRKIFNYKKANWDELNRELLLTDWETILADANVEICWDKFKSILHDLCSKHIPLVTVKSDFQPPWFDSEVFAKCREKDKWHKKLKRTQSTNHELKYRNCRRELKQLIRTKMKANFSDEFSENAITKKFWSYVKRSSNAHRIPESINYNGRFRNSPLEQANLFNEFFYEQFSKKSLYNIPIDYSKKFEIDFKAHNICNILCQLDPNKAPGPDMIHGLILKNCAHSLSIPLQIIFRTSYYTCKIPKEWKLAHVVPVHKKGPKNSVENYRPISLTSIIMKVYERIIREDLLVRCSSKLKQHQHGFLPGKSCETQLIPFYDNLARTLNDGSRTDIIYFDFAKAFDSVNHDLILHKLKTQFNIDGLLLKFFVEYLSNRDQIVVVGNKKSSLLRVESGVPQGSILGPLLFVIFIDDISNGLSEDSNIALYADDTKLYRAINNDADHLALQYDINTLNDWATKNLMRFHPDKCKVLSVTLCKPPIYSNVLPFYNFIYCLGNTPLDFVRSEKDLGVHINSTLTWTEHNNFIYSKANRKLGLLKRTCHFVKNLKQRRSLYLAIIRSQFEHCSSVWSSNNSTTIKKVESMQRKAIKWIYGEEYCSYSDECYYLKCKELDLLPISYRMQHKDLKLLHNIINNRSAIKLPNYIHFYIEGRRLRSSHMDELCLISDINPKISRNYRAGEVVASSFSQFSNSYFYRTIQHWNKLPIEIRRIPCPHKFESRVYKYLWEVARPPVAN